MSRAEQTWPDGSSSSARQKPQGFCCLVCFGLCASSSAKQSKMGKGRGLGTFKQISLNKETDRSPQESRVSECATGPLFLATGHRERSEGAAPLVCQCIGLSATTQSQLCVHGEMSPSQSSECDSGSQTPWRLDQKLPQLTTASRRQTC